MSDPLFARFLRLAAADIVSMRGTEQENHNLDFKLLRSADLKERDDRTNLGKAISGFANADGGIIVWGVDARKDERDEGIDQVVETPGLANPRLTLARLNDLAGEATAPVVIGVQTRLVKRRLGPSFALTYVPASDSGPHMCMLGAETHRYFARAAGRFSKLEHFQIADMFGRRARPRLAIEIYPRLETQYAYGFRVTNSGRGPAIAPYVQLSAPSPFHAARHGVDGNGNEALPLVRTHRGPGWLHASGTDFVLHPTMSIELGGMWVGHGPHPPARVALIEKARVVQYKLGALGIAPIEGELQLP